jgi:hypothetical protein
MANPGYPNVIAVRKETGDTPTDLTMPDELEGLKVALYVYDPDSLSWVRMRQPLMSPMADDLPLDTRFENDSNKNIKYKGIHATHKALISDVNWLIWKFTWELISSSYCLARIEGPLEGAWNNRDNLGWA